MKNAIFSLLAGASALLSPLSAEPLFFSPQMIANHLNDYSAEEKELIAQDLAVVRSLCLPSQPQQPLSKPQYIATAGAPGSRKTTILERFLSQRPQTEHIAYIDPDQRALKFMVHTYLSQSLSARVVAEQPLYGNAVKAAYEKWRGGSNFIALTLLEEAFASRRSVAYGTTSTGEHTPKFLANVKAAGYEVTLLLCSCEDPFRQKAVQYRNEEQKFYQSTPEDALANGKLFPQRMAAYFAYADVLQLFWSDDLAHPERLAAELRDGKLNVIDPEAFRLFANKYEADRALLAREGQQLPSWDGLLFAYKAARTR